MEAQHPNNDCYSDACPQSTILWHHDRVHNGSVAFQRHDNHEEDATEEAGVVGDSSKAANEVSKGPRADHSIVSVERQREDEEEVRDSEV